MKLRHCLACLALLCLLGPPAAWAQDQVESIVPADPDLTFALDGADTLRSNLWVAEALLGEAVQTILAELPPAPAAVVLVPASSDQAVNLLSEVATYHLQRAGYDVHLDMAPGGTDLPVVELRYRVSELDLSYPDTGRRLLFWKSWIARQMDFVGQFTVVDHADGQVLASQRLARSFQDRIPPEYFAAVESNMYQFTRAEQKGGTWSRRIEEFVVLGALVGLVAIYFANTE